MPPETRDAVRLLVVSLATNADRSGIREQIEVLADQLERRTTAKAGER